MDMLSGTQITAADVADWRKLGQGLHARFAIGHLSEGVRSWAASARPVLRQEITSMVGSAPAMSI